MRSLGDKDGDVWRTIQSWMDTHRPGDERGPKLTLVTTQQARPGTAMAALTVPNPAPAEALKPLVAAAQESKAKEAKDARTAFWTCRRRVRAAGGLAASSSSPSSSVTTAQLALFGPPVEAAVRAVARSGRRPVLACRSVAGGRVVRLRVGR
ncbi:hypothetical protein ABZY81_34430, partial [Streptomyces sp. NPDC006514]